MASMARLAALMSPWTDLTLSHATHSSKARVDPYFPSRERLQLAARHYAGATALVAGSAIFGKGADRYAAEIAALRGR